MLSRALRLEQLLLILTAGIAEGSSVVRIGEASTDFTNSTNVYFSRNGTKDSLEELRYDEEVEELLRLRDDPLPDMSSTPLLLQDRPRANADSQEAGIHASVNGNGDVAVKKRRPKKLMQKDPPPQRNKRLERWMSREPPPITYTHPPASLLKRKWMRQHIAKLRSDGSIEIYRKGQMVPDPPPQVHEADGSSAAGSEVQEDIQEGEEAAATKESKFDEVQGGIQEGEEAAAMKESQSNEVQEGAQEVGEEAASMREPKSLMRRSNLAGRF